MSNPRGIRNHNPGNIRRTADRWQGLSKVQSDPAFFQFDSPIYGIRALARVLIAYQDKHGLRTPREIIARWAPAVENNVDAYVHSVGKATGFLPDDMLDLHRYEDLEPLVRAIIRHENGQQPYTQAQIDKALVLAGVEPPAKPLSSTGTARGVAVGVGGVAGTAVAVVETVERIEPHLPLIERLLSTYPIWIGLAVVGLALGFVMWRRADDRKKALR